MSTARLLVMGFWRDSFEAQTDRMSATDAQGVLLDRIRATQEEISPGSRSIRTAWINAPKESPPLPPNDNPLANALVLLREIEDLLSPGSKGFWKLQLGQRRTGERKVPSAITEDILRAYGGELALEDHPRPKKVIIGDLAKEYGLTDAAVRETIRRAHGKKPKRRPKK
jgi:hypothetical protein